MNTSKLKEPDTRSNVPKLLPVSNFSDSDSIIKQKMIEKIKYAPVDAIQFDGTWKRFVTNKQNNGAYIASEWEFQNKFYWRISFIDYAGSQVWETITSWEDENHFNEWNEKDKKAFHEERKRIETEQKRQQKEADENRKKEAAAKWTSFSGQKLNKEFSYFVNKGYRLEDIKKADPEIILSSDKYGEFVAFPLKQGQEITGYQKISPIKWDGKNKFNCGIKKGSYHQLGKENLEHPEKLNICFIVEGYVTGLSVHEATGKLVYIAVDAGNLKHVVKAAIEETRAINPNCLIVIGADKDENFTGEKEAKKACEYQLGVSYKLPHFSDSEAQEDLSDFDDLRRVHGIKEVKKQLDLERIINKYKGLYIKYKGCYVSIIKKGEATKPDYIDLQNPQFVSNFVIELCYEFKEETGNTKRYIKLIGLRETSKKELCYEASVFKNESEFRTFLYANGKFTIEKEFSVERLKKTLIEEKAPIVNPLIKSGKHKEKFFFDNCVISQHKLNEPLDNGFFDDGIDDRGNKLALKLEHEGEKPKLNLQISKKEAQFLLNLFLDSLKKAYGYNAIFALGCVFSGLIRDEIAEITGTNQFPVLWLYGEAQAGKSSLIKKFEILQGFKGKAINANSTEPTIRKFLTSRSGLINPIYEVKPRYMEKIELIVQNSYDGTIRARQGRKGNDWRTTKDEPDGFLIFDSNHLPSMASVLERIIAIDFKKKNFKLQEAKVLNIHEKKLSGITRHFLESLNPLEASQIVNKRFESFILSDWDSRDALNASYGIGGYELLLKAFEYSENDIQQELDHLTQYIHNWVQSVKEDRQTGSIVNNFFEYFFHKFLPSKNSFQNENNKPNIQLKEHQGKMKLIIPTDLINQAVEEHEERKRGIIDYSKHDLQQALKRLDWVQTNEQIWNEGKNGRYYTITNNAQLVKPIKEFIDSSDIFSKEYKESFFGLSHKGNIEKLRKKDSEPF